MDGDIDELEGADLFDTIAGEEEVPKKRGRPPGVKNKNPEVSKTEGTTKTDSKEKVKSEVPPGEAPVKRGRGRPKGPKQRVGVGGVVQRHQNSGLAWEGSSKSTKTAIWRKRGRPKAPK